MRSAYRQAQTTTALSIRRLRLPARGHNDEILDVAFNATGSKLVTASADGTARVYNTMTGACQSILVGHEGEISKVLRIRLRPCAQSLLSTLGTIIGTVSAINRYR